MEHLEWFINFAKLGLVTYAVFSVIVTIGVLYFIYKVWKDLLK